MLSGLHTWTLTAIAIAAGVAMLWAFARCSDQARIEVAKRKLRAHLLAFRLFSDEPRLIFRSQKQLLIWNARYLALMLRPTLVMMLPLVVLLWHLDAVYGHRRSHRAKRRSLRRRWTLALICLRFSNARRPRRRGRDHAAGLQDARQFLWRVRVVEPASSANSRAVVMQLDGASVEKIVQSGAGLDYLSERRVGSWFTWLRYPLSRVCPRARSSGSKCGILRDIGVFGIGMHWLIWFCIVNLFTMLALRKRFGVTF